MDKGISEEYEQYTPGLVLLDAVPVLLFLMTGIIIYSMYGSPVFLAGAIASFIGGSCKVIWKLIVVLKKRDVEVLTKAFRKLMPAGFILMFLSVIISAAGDVISGTPVSEGTLSGLWRGLTMMPAVLFFIAGSAGMCFMGYLGSHMDKSARANWIEELVNTLAQLAFLIGVVAVYFGSYYHADAAAISALESTDSVSVQAEEELYYFDGPGTDTALVFYPGAKVEASAYAPLLHDLADGGIDCYLCKMPLNFALLGKDAADEIRTNYEEGNDKAAAGNHYETWLIGGHSLGGAAASMYLEKAEHGSDTWSGIIFLASYPSYYCDIPALMIYGTEDEIINTDKVYSAEDIWPGPFDEQPIDGGNHAQFGNYGAQKGDGRPDISQDEQQKCAETLIFEWFNSFSL